jgi:hypothetical protein
LAGGFGTGVGATWCAGAAPAWSAWVAGVVGPGTAARSTDSTFSSFGSRMVMPTSSTTTTRICATIETMAPRRKPGVMDDAHSSLRRRLRCRG